MKKAWFLPDGRVDMAPLRLAEVQNSSAAPPPRDSGQHRMSGTGARIPLSWNHAERDGAMNWITGIQRALDYVEAHLMESVDYEEAAKQAYSSSFHFQRVFSILCGFTLGDYIRMRRLTLAGSELASSDIRVIDAALKYGYDTPESFSRAFTRFHGVPPSQAKHGAALKAFSPLSVKLTLDGGSTMDYRIETVEAFRLICRKKQIPSRAELTEAVISPFWRECTTDGTIEALCRYIPEPNIFGDRIVGASFGRDAADAESPPPSARSYNGAPVTDAD